MVNKPVEKLLQFHTPYIKTVKQYYEEFKKLDQIKTFDDLILFLNMNVRQHKRKNIIIQLLYHLEKAKCIYMRLKITRLMN